MIDYKHYKNRSYTLTELLVVVIILSIAAGFAIPAYDRALEKQYYKQALINLRTIHGANEMYRTRNNEYLDPSICGGACDIDDLNQHLEINITDDNFDYNYSGDSENYTVEATPIGLNHFSEITLTLTEGLLSENNPYCEPSSDCP